MRFDMQKAIVAVLLLAATTTYARAETSNIELVNLTYTPLHYRVRNRGEEFTEWRLLMPGDKTYYRDLPHLIMEVQHENDGVQQYKLVSGDTYAYYRGEPRARPEFAARNGREIPAVPGPPPADASSAEASFAPLTKFVARCKELNQPYRLSLKKLAAECSRAQKDGAKLSAALRNLHGFTWFVGYLVDDGNGDVVLLGVKDPTRPPLDIDCLATAIKAAYSDSVPYCSLEVDPNPEVQKSIVRGVPWNTYWADVMIRADYDMKRLGQGQLDPSIKGFKSQEKLLEEILAMEGFPAEGQPSSAKGDYENRWWFNFNSQVPRAVADANGNLVYLYRNPVRVSTEQLVDGSYGSGQTTQSATKFAENFTEHLKSWASTIQALPNCKRFIVCMT